MPDQRLHPEQVLSEFEGVRLGDERLERRVVAIVNQLAASPGASFPCVMTSGAEREALYRFLGNKKVTIQGLLAGHVAQTHRRLAKDQEVRVVHDTTSLVYAGERDGLGPVKGRGKGFYAHVALAVSADEDRHALGVLGVHTWANSVERARAGRTRSQQAAYAHRLPRESKLSSRWERLAAAISVALPKDVQAIHIMDQEADDFALLAALVHHKLRFVVRGSGQRRLIPGSTTSISTLLDSKLGRVFRTVRLSSRRNFRDRSGRSERDAELFIRWSRVTLPKPQYGQSDATQLTLNVVHVYEPRPPPGEERVEWFLLTSDPVETMEDATQVVDHYRARWLVEEFFKALKTGCAIEKRQLTTYDALLRVLGLLLPIAWRLLVLRQLANESHPKPASALFEPDDLRLVHVLLRERRKDHKLPNKPTVRDMMLAIAAIGGHIPNNGDPGWQVLGRGFQIYVDAEAIWRAARCDQS